MEEEARVGDATVPHPGGVQPALREPGDRGRYGNPYAKPIFYFIASSRTFSLAGGGAPCAIWRYRAVRVFAFTTGAANAPTTCLKAGNQIECDGDNPQEKRHGRG